MLGHRLSAASSRSSSSSLLDHRFIAEPRKVLLDGAGILFEAMNQSYFVLLQNRDVLEGVIFVYIPKSILGFSSFGYRNDILSKLRNFYLNCSLGIPVTKLGQVSFKSWRDKCLLRNIHEQRRYPRRKWILVTGMFQRNSISSN